MQIELEEPRHGLEIARLDVGHEVVGDHHRQMTAVLIRALQGPVHRDRRGRGVQG